MGQWEHRFIDGEFMSRARLLSGLTVEQVSMRPSGLRHTIYEELWHTTKWQSIVVRCDEPAAAAWIDGGQDFPSEAPGNERTTSGRSLPCVRSSMRGPHRGRFNGSQADPETDMVTLNRLAAGDAPIACEPPNPGVKLSGLRPAADAPVVSRRSVGRTVTETAMTDRHPRLPGGEHADCHI
jgi:hypothetical protein